MKRIRLFERVPIDTISTKEIINTTVRWASRHQKKMIFYMNAYNVVSFLRDRKYRQAVRPANIICADGWGPVIASRFFKEKLQERVNVGDFIDDLLSRLNKRSLKLYLLGCEEETVHKTTKEIQKQFPNVKICGSHHGFFSKKEERMIIKHMQESRPHVVLVGMSTPKQELWIFENWPTLPDAVYMGVGGAFHYVAKTKSRAPRWMREGGLEWMYRLFQEPRRLWKRYTVDNLIFVSLFLGSLILVWTKKSVGFITKLSSPVQGLMNGILFHVMYLLGIGTTSLFSKLAGKRFLKITSRESTWENPTGSDESNKMY